MTNRFILMIAAIVAAICCTTGVAAVAGRDLPQVAHALTGGPGDDSRSERIIYYNDFAPADQPYNFANDVYRQLIEGGSMNLVDDAMNELYTHNYHDPVNASATALALDWNAGTDIMRDYASLPIGSRGNEAAADFIADEKKWDGVCNQIKAKLESASEVYIDDLDAYTSQMYMIPGAFEGGRPALTVKDTHHSGGHVLVFVFGDGSIVKFRLECGFQPTDIPWEPGNPPGNPPSETTPPPSETTPPPSETTPPTTTTLTPKDPGQAPPVQDDPDIGGTVVDVDKTPTPEPEIEDLPDAYEPPAPPVQTQAQTKPVSTTQVPTTQAPPSTTKAVPVNPQGTQNAPGIEDGGGNTPKDPVVATDPVVTKPVAPEDQQNFEDRFR